MTEIIIGIEHGEKLKFRPPITSKEAYEILKLDPRAGSGTLSDKNDYCTWYRLAKPCSRQPMGHSFSGGRVQVCIMQPPFYALP